MAGNNEKDGEKKDKPDKQGLVGRVWSAWGTFALALIIVLIIIAFYGAIKKAHGMVRIVGTFGQTYHIKEKNLLDVIKSRAGLATDYIKKERRNAKKIVENYQPRQLEVNLPPARHTRTFAPNMWYTNPRTIKDAKGNVIYPKGYRFKITDYAVLPYVLVVINGDDKKQVSWFVNSKYYKNIDVMLMITKGSYYRLSKRFQMPVFYYLSSMQPRFTLKAVPDVIWQKGTTLFVKQIGGL